MMEAPPSAALIVAEADFLFEFLIVALDAPAQLGEVDESAERHALVDGCEAEFCGRSFILRPFDKQRLFGETRFAPHWGGVHAHAGKARPQFRVAAFPPRDGAPGVLWKAARQRFDTDAPRLPIILAHRTHFDRRYDGRHIFQSKSRDRLAQGAVRPITRIHQHDPGGNTRHQSRTDLLQRKLRLGLEPNRRWHMRLGAARLIVGPIPWQIKPIGDRQTAISIGDRQRHCNLAIGLLAELAAILMMHPDRILDTGLSWETRYRR